MSEDVLGFLLMAVFVTVLFGGATVGALWWLKRGHVRLATDLRGEGFTDADADIRGVTGSHGGRTWHVMHHAGGRRKPTTTRVHYADVRVPDGLTVDVRAKWRRTVSLGRITDVPTVATGDGAFDRGFRVRATDAERATFILGAAEREAVTTHRVRGVRVDETGVIVALQGRVRDARRVADAIRFTERLAERVSATV